MLTKEQAYKKYGGTFNKNSHINFESVETALQGDEWIPEFSEFIFDPKDLEKSFSWIKKSKTWYPKPDTFIDIGKKIGIEFVNVLEDKGEIIEYIKDNININIMHCISELKEPCIRSKAISVRVTKAGRCRNGDGTFSNSGPCSAEHNFYDKILQSWTKNVQDYNTAQKRLTSYYQKKEHALAIAQTKARNAVITVLAGLKKGFTTEDLKDGCFGFVKFVRSPQYQKMYTMAKIDAIRKGKTGEIQDMSTQLFGDKQIEAPIEPINEIITDDKHPENEINPFSDFKPEPDERTKIKNILERYIKEQENKIKSVTNAYDYISMIIIKYENTPIKKLKDVLKKVENEIPGIEKIEHDINLDKEEGAFK